MHSILRLPGGGGAQSGFGSPDFAIMHKDSLDKNEELLIKRAVRFLCNFYEFLFSKYVQKCGFVVAFNRVFCIHKKRFVKVEFVKT